MRDWIKQVKQKNVDKVEKQHEEIERRL